MDSVYLENSKRKGLLFSLWDQEKPTDCAVDIEEQLNSEREMIKYALSEFGNRSGMPIIQENGERRYGPPVGFTGTPPTKDSEVFVGGLPRDCYEYELISFLERVGRVHEMRLMMNFSGNNRGFAFVLYETRNDAEKAVQELNNSEIREGWRICVVKSNDKKSVYIGNVPRDKSEQDITEEINKIAIGVVKVTTPKPFGNPRYHQNRGFTFVEFENHRFAVNFISRTRNINFRMWDFRVKVKWAEPPSMSRAITVSNLSEETSAADVETIFNRATNNGVVRVEKIIRCAIVYFQTRHKAKMAIKKMDKKLIDGLRVKVHENIYIDNAHMQRDRSELSSRNNDLMATSSALESSVYPYGCNNVPVFLPQDQMRVTTNNDYGLFGYENTLPYVMFAFPNCSAPLQ